MPDIQLTHCGPDDGGNFEYGWSNGYLEAHFISDVGKKRENNEDSCLMCAPQDTTLASERGALFAIADGMGGASAGEFASRLSLQIFTKEYYRSAPKSVPRLLSEAVEAANRRVYDAAEGNPEYHGMGTTLSSLTILGDGAYIAHVGDSRVYLLRENNLVQITDDHSLVAEQVRTGIISEEEARDHSLKNLITRAIGIKDSVEPDLLSLRLHKNDIFLICSDGLSNMVEDVDIASSLEAQTLQGAARILVGKALEGGGSDNISVALVRISETPPKAALQPGCVELNVAGQGILGKLKRLMS